MAKHGILWSDATAVAAKAKAEHLAVINFARGEDATWDGILAQVANEVVAETEPTLLLERLMDLSKVVREFSNDVKALIKDTAKAAVVDDEPEADE